MGDEIVVGFDATDDAVIAIEDGKMKATVAQKPDLMGEQAVDAAVHRIRDCFWFS